MVIGLEKIPFMMCSCFILREEHIWI